MTDMSKQEVMQQVIHEDFKQIVNYMHQFRTDTYGMMSSSQQQVAGSKYAMSKRWVCFYQNMVNHGIFWVSELEKNKTKLRIQPRLAKLILASQIEGTENAESNDELS